MPLCCASQSYNFTYSDADFGDDGGSDDGSSNAYTPLPLETMAGATNLGSINYFGASTAPTVDVAGDRARPGLTCPKPTP